jgi:EAL domain-containing protein (putative c-di-GMP-specific phosphodiesterase class I)
MNCTFANESVAGAEVLPGCALRTYFQPICSVKAQSVLGVEALARGLDDAGELIAPAHLFALAAERCAARQCEMACRHGAIATFAATFAGASPLLLFMNLNLLASSGADDVEQLLAEASRWSVPPQSIVVEVLESRFDDSRRLADTLCRFRERGFLVALDDVGAGHSNLDRIPLIRPDILKVDRDLVRHLDWDYYKQGVFRSLAYLARRIGALVVAEGVETEAEAITALELGADLLQGYYLSRPAPPESSLLHRAEYALQALARRFKRHMVEKTSRRRHAHRQYNVLVETVLCNLTCSPSADFGAVLRHAARKFGAIECAYVLDETGIQVTETACRSGGAAERNSGMFQPAPAGADHSLKEYYYMLLDAELPRYTTDPYVSLATGNLCQTISTCFRDGFTNRLYVLCIDIKVS